MLGRAAVATLEARQVAKTIILDDPYPFFEGYGAKEDLVDGVSWTVHIDCGCSGHAIPGGPNGHQWQMTLLCPIHGAASDQ